MIACAAACLCHLYLASPAPAQVWDDSIVAKHVRIRQPFDRQWLGRETVADLERCWEFVDSATGGTLPRRVLIVIDWRGGLATVDASLATVSIGLGNPAAEADVKGFLLHGSARELARMALMALSGNGAAREGNRFLLEGMAEMIARDFSNSVKRLGAAWAVCYYLDRMNPLGLKQMTGRPEFSRPAHDLSTAAPGITFLTTCRELYGRERVLKLFETLARKNLEESIAVSFRTTAAGLETQWLERVRGYSPADVTIASQEEAPALDRVLFVPDPGKAGATLGLRLFIRDGANDLLSGGIFVVDESSGQVLRGRQTEAAGSRFTQVEIPIDAARQDGRYRLRIVAVDEGGNIRNWETSYSIAR